MALYLLDPARRRVLLERVEVSGNRPQFTFLAREMDPRQTPLETLQSMVKEKANVEMEPIGYQTAVPAVLDYRAVRMASPLFVQLTYVDHEKDFVDHVYLGVASTSVEFPEDGKIGWFNAEDLVGNAAPKYVKRAVRQILILARSM